MNFSTLMRMRCENEDNSNNSNLTSTLGAISGERLTAALSVTVHGIRTETGWEFDNFIHIIKWRG